METLSPSTGAITVSTHQLTPGVVYDYDWNFARAFLYSLTVLTTIGELEQFFLHFTVVEASEDSHYLNAVDCYDNEWKTV